MYARSSLSLDQRVQAVVLFEQGLGSAAVSKKLEVRRDPVKKLHQRWKLHGRDVLMRKAKNTSYSYEFKLDVAQRHIDGEEAAALAAEHQLSSPMLVKSWSRTLRRYGPAGLAPKPRGRPSGQPAKQKTEVERLQEENLRLQAENAYLKKLRALRDQSEQA